MKRHEKWVAIEELGRVVGVACEWCARFKALEGPAALVVADVTVMELDDGTACDEAARSNEEWESQVKAQVMAAGLAAQPA